MHGMNI